VRVPEAIEEVVKGRRVVHAQEQQHEEQLVAIHYQVAEVTCVESHVDQEDDQHYQRHRLRKVLEPLPLALGLLAVDVERSQWGSDGQLLQRGVCAHQVVVPEDDCEQAGGQGFRSVYLQPNCVEVEHTHAVGKTTCQQSATTHLPLRY
jgi:hypothetical protein